MPVRLELRQLFKRWAVFENLSLPAAVGRYFCTSSCPMRLEKSLGVQSRNTFSTEDRGKRLC